MYQGPRCPARTLLYSNWQFPIPPFSIYLETKGFSIITETTPKLKANRNNAQNWSGTFPCSQ